jgi:glutaredoxin-like protein
MPEDREDDEVVIYYQPWCVYCINLLTQLRFTRLRYRTVHIGRDREAAAFVRSVADGNETVPTVTVAGHPMVNPSKRQLLAAAAQHAPHTLT